MFDKFIFLWKIPQSLSLVDVFFFFCSKCIVLRLFSVSIFSLYSFACSNFFFLLLRMRILCAPFFRGNMVECIDAASIRSKIGGTSCLSIVREISSWRDFLYFLKFRPRKLVVYKFFKFLIANVMP